MRFEYTATRNLATGHVLDDSYEIILGGWVIEPTHVSVGPENTSVDGTLERELYRMDLQYRVQTDAIEAGQDLENFEEFLYSVAASETFTFDPDAETATPVTPLTCIMVSRRFPRQRISSQKFQFTFDVRVAP